MSIFGQANFFSCPLRYKIDNFSGAKTERLCCESRSRNLRPDSAEQMRPRNVPDPLDVHDLPRISLREKFVEQRQNATVVADKHHFGERCPLLHSDRSELNLAMLLFCSRILADDRLELLEGQPRLRAARGIAIAV